jgi:hypothetical protein
LPVKASGVGPGHAVTRRALAAVDEQRSRNVTVMDGRRALRWRIRAPDLGRHRVAGGRQLPTSR